VDILEALLLNVVIHPSRFEDGIQFCVLWVCVSASEPPEDPCSLVVILRRLYIICLMTPVDFSKFQIQNDYHDIEIDVMFCS